MKNIIGVIIVYWCVCLRKTRKIRFLAILFLNPANLLMQKYHLNNCWTPYAYTPSSNTLGLLLHLQYFQRCKSTIFRIWRNVNVFRDNQVIIKRNDKKDKKIHVFEVLIFFENIELLSIQGNSLQTPPLTDIILGSFTLSNSTILVEDPIQ